MDRDSHPPFFQQSRHDTGHEIILLRADLIHNRLNQFIESYAHFPRSRCGYNGHLFYTLSSFCHETVDPAVSEALMTPSEHLEPSCVFQREEGTKCAKI